MRKTILLLIMLFVPFNLLSQKQGQDLVDSLLAELPRAKEDSNKVLLLNKLTRAYSGIEPKTGLEYGNKGIELADKIAWKKGKAFVYNSIGINYQVLSEFEKAIEVYNKALEINTEAGDKENISNNENNIAIIYAMQGEYNEALKYFLNSLDIYKGIGANSHLANGYGNIGIIYKIQGKFDESREYFHKSLEIYEELNDQAGIAKSYSNIGISYSDQGDHEKSLVYYLKALKINRELGIRDIVALNSGNIGNSYRKLGKFKEALDYYDIALGIYRDIGNSNGIVINLTNMSYLNLRLGEIKDSLALLKNIEIKVPTNEARAYYQNALKFAMEAEELAEEIDLGSKLYDVYNTISKSHKKLGNFELALEYSEKFIVEKDRIFNESKNQQIEEMKAKYEAEKNEARIEFLEEEQDSKNRVILLLVIILLLIIFLTIISYNRYRLNKKATILLEEKNRLEIENRKKVINLFGQQVSQEIVNELLSDTTAEETKKKFVCIMFLDIRGFTPLMENKEPEEIIEYQNSVFGFMIEIINKHHGIINQFLGDGYMATFGAPISKGNDSQNAMDAAMEIVSKVNEKSESGEIPYTKIGIGLHSGNVVAGNVGTQVRKQYSITGNTVILASRIEQLNKKFNSQVLISEDVLKNLDHEKYEYESLGPVGLKGREKPINIYRLY